MTVRRFDTGGVLLRPHKRPQDGVMLAEGIPTREGILEYRRADGSIRRELVTREAVLDSARTCPRAALTLDHPAEGFVDPDNAGKLIVGDVDGAATVEEDAQGGYARVKVAVRRRDALDAVAAGTHELSLGYAVSLDETPGEHPVWGRYDARQIGREVNHLAIVPKGRAGPTAALRIDHDDRFAVIPPSPAQGHRTDSSEVSMKPALLALLTALGVERFDSEDTALADALPLARKARADAAKYNDEFVEELQKSKTDTEKQLEAMKADNEKLKGEVEAFKAKSEKAEKEEQDRKDAAELERLRGVATKLGVKHDGLDLPKLRVAICKTRVDSVDDKTPAARLDGILEVVVADAAKAGQRSRYDWSDPPAKGGGNGERADGADPEAARRNDDFYNPYLDAADKARTAGGAQ